MKYLLLLPVAAVLGLFILAAKSKSGQAPGLQNNLLQACPNKPNCVCSETADNTAHFVAPMTFKTEDIEKIRSLLKNSLESQGGKLVTETTNYMAFIFQSKFFGFIDDFELRLDEENKTIHFRSASRVGRSDLNVNRKRVERIRSELLKMLEQ